jgi:eukaryotic-like serine/threonine-protein kinase
MSSARWKQVEEIFHAALEREAAARMDFLNEVCAEDPDLRREVDSLLKAAGEGGSFMERPAMEVEAETLSREPKGALTGRKIANYRVGPLLGVGGMAEVYRARDLTLERDVAIKVLTGSSGLDTEGIARFQREARLLASVTHPNVAAVYGFEQVDGMCALIMEVVEGETLSDRIARKRPSVEEALAIASQIASAVEAAHNKDIIHRDLKPSNIRITHTGHVKVLDFGLAKLVQPAAGDDGSGKSVFSTQGFSIAGTIAYMSPEQARGRPVDRTTDVWAWGCVLYELLTGSRAFEGSTATDTIAKIASEDPVWENLPSETPAAARALLEDCLQKDRNRRVRDISEARRRIENAYKPKALPPAQPEIAMSLPAARGLFLFAQFGYLAMYCAALFYLDQLNPGVVLLVAGAALLGIPVRLYLMSAVALAHPAAGQQFHRLFPALIVLDGAWAASPLLISKLPIGIALAAVAGLAYVPFAQRTLIRRIYLQ